jgi:hypothetical protein
MDRKALSRKRKKGGSWASYLSPTDSPSVERNPATEGHELRSQSKDFYVIIINYYYHHYYY